MIYTRLINHLLMKIKTKNQLRVPVHHNKSYFKTLKSDTVKSKKKSNPRKVQNQNKQTPRNLYHIRKKSIFPATQTSINRQKTQSLQSKFSSVPRQKQTSRISSIFKKSRSRFVKGFVILKKYKVLKTIGKGAQGKILKVNCLSSKTLFAMKVISLRKLNMSKQTKTEIMLLKVIINQNEIQVMRNLGYSQHTVQYIEDFRDKEFVYIVMSYEGETNMAEFLKKNRLLSVNQFGFCLNK
mgnify:CR=1 FL=1